MGMIEYFGQRIKTRTEVVRFFNSFKCTEYIKFIDAKVIDSHKNFETYSMEEFIDYEYRTGDRARILEISFRPADEDFYLNRDLMSFLSGILFCKLLKIIFRRRKFFSSLPTNSVRIMNIHLTA